LERTQTPETVFAIQGLRKTKKGQCREKKVTKMKKNAEKGGTFLATGSLVCRLFLRLLDKEKVGGVKLSERQP